VNPAAPVVFSVRCSSSSNVDEFESQYANLSLLSWYFGMTAFELKYIATAQNINYKEGTFTPLFLWYSKFLIWTIATFTWFQWYHEGIIYQFNSQSILGNQIVKHSSPRKRE